MDRKGGKIFEWEEKRGKMEERGWGKKQRDRKTRIFRSRWALVDTAFQGIFNDFIFFFTYALPLSKKLRIYEQHCFWHSQSNGVLVELRVWVMTEQLLITGMCKLQNWEYIFNLKGKLLFYFLSFLEDCAVPSSIIPFSVRGIFCTSCDRQFV